MVNITLSIPTEMKNEMNKFEDINWSGVVRKSISERLEKLTWKQNMLKKINDEKGFNEWAVKICREGRKGRFEELKKKGFVKWG